MQNFKHQLTFDMEPHCLSLAISPNGKLLVSGGLDRNTINIWDTQTGKLLNYWIATPVPQDCNVNLKYPLESIAISYDGLTLITGGISLKTWKLETGKRIRVLKGGFNNVGNVQVNSDDTIAIAGINGKTVIWDLIKNEKIRSSLQLYWMIDPSFKVLVSWGNDNVNPIKIFDFTTEKEIFTLRNKAGIKVLTIAFSPNGKFLAGGGHEGIIIWELETGECIQTINKFKNIKFHEHLDQIFSIIFSLDNSTLLSTGKDGIIQIWDCNTGKNVGTIPGENLTGQIYMSNDSKTLIGFNSFTQKVDVWKSNNKY
jgi:WD40 repeat protein